MPYLASKMGLFDRFFRQKQLDVDNPVLGPVDALHVGKQDKLFQVLQECGLTYNRKHVRDFVRLSRMMYEIFPFAKRAIGDMAAMVGEVCIESKEEDGVSPEVLEELNLLLDTLPILSERDWENPHQKGASNLVERIARSMLIDGMSFSENRFEEGDLLSRYQGVLLYDALSFDFEKIDTQPERLRYGAQYPDPNIFEYGGLNYKEGDSWGMPLLYGGEFFTDILVSMLVAVKNINYRKAAPIEFGGIGFKNVDKIPKEKVDTAIKTLQSTQGKMKKALINQQNGIPSSLYTTFAFEPTLVSRAFGIEGLKEVDTEMLSLILGQFASLLETPPEFLGLVMGSQLSSNTERFKVLYNIWGQKIGNLRQKQHSIVRKAVDFHLIEQGADIALLDRVRIAYKDMDFETAEDRAKLRETQARADQMIMQTAQGLAQVDTTHARNYLVKNGLIDDNA